MVESAVFLSFVGASCYLFGRKIKRLISFPVLLDIWMLTTLYQSICNVFLQWRLRRVDYLGSITRVDGLKSLGICFCLIIRLLVIFHLYWFWINMILVCFFRWFACKKHHESPCSGIRKSWFRSSPRLQTQWSFGCSCWGNGKDCFCKVGFMLCALTFWWCYCIMRASLSVGIITHILQAKLDCEIKLEGGGLIEKSLKFLLHQKEAPWYLVRYILTFICYSLPAT